jgi:hypothetical protein
VRRGSAVRTRQVGAAGAAVLVFCLAFAPDLRAQESAQPAAEQGTGWNFTWRWADDSEKDRNAVTAFFGEGTEDDFSTVVNNLFNVDRTSNRITAITGIRRFAWLGNHLGFEGEIMYAYHHGRETYHEFAAAVYARWHAFPWNDFVSTTMAAGVGPSYTTVYPQLEFQEGDDSKSKILNQANLELTLAMPRHPHTQLLFRLQHRSGIFGLINGVTDASNFLTLGLRHRF